MSQLHSPHTGLSCWSGQRRGTGSIIHPVVMHTWKSIHTCILTSTYMYIDVHVPRPPTLFSLLVDCPSPSQQQQQQLETLCYSYAPSTTATAAEGAAGVAETAVGGTGFRMVVLSVVVGGGGGGGGDAAVVSPRSTRCTQRLPSPETVSCSDVTRSLSMHGSTTSRARSAASLPFSPAWTTRA